MSSKKRIIVRKRKVRNYEYLEGLLVRNKFYSSLVFLVIRAEKDGTLLVEREDDGMKLALSVKEIKVMTPKDIEGYLSMSLRNHLVNRAWEQYKELEASL